MPRPTARSRRRDRVFFAALENGHRIGAACAAAGYARASVYEWRRSDAEFEKRWQCARELALDLLENEADRRGREGTDEPVFFEGAKVGTKRKYSDRLLLARLKAEMPEKYGPAPLRAPVHEAERPVMIMRDFAVEDFVVRVIADGRASVDELRPGVLERINGGRKEAGLELVPAPALPMPDERGE